MNTDGLAPFIYGIQRQLRKWDVVSLMNGVSSPAVSLKRSVPYNATEFRSTRVFHYQQGVGST